MGVPERRALLWPHPGHGDGSFAHPSYGSGARLAGGDASGEPERRRGDHGPQDGGEEADAAGGVGSCWGCVS